MTNPVRIRGVDYPSQKAAADALGVSSWTIHYRLNRGTMQDLGATRPKTGPVSAIPCIVHGVRYKSMTEAKKVLRLSNGAFETLIRKGNVTLLMDERPPLTPR
ncbi:hypothetical protein P67b_00014 [Ruegeria phage Tedan]|nr:hypothetical protein P67b_00014 [Ruegeria phage Tedan]